MFVVPLRGMHMINFNYAPAFKCAELKLQFFIIEVTGFLLVTYQGRSLVA